ncbi:MAG TPA: tetratricopeptide repeat protein [Pyrinomonadaceae bacterium]|nr:tetratricopeptide repeat protein [Pyrinomonadaceae bacterium]
MKILPIFILLLFSSMTFAQICPDHPKIVEPILSENARKVYETKLAEAKTDYEKNPNADAIIWFGRRVAYLGDYKQSINIFTEGTNKFPKDARFYRHRGHRFITIRCFDEAIKDFETAAKLIKGKPDEIEPDGLPNVRNIPTSTLQSNIFYHLGLAYYLKGNFKKAVKAYWECLKVSKNDDMHVATVHWLYMTLRRMDKEKEAKIAITSVGYNLDIIENYDYYKLIKLYQGKLKPEDLLKLDSDTLGNVSLGYGVGNWYLYNGKTDEAMKLFRQITGGNQWASFGFIAAEAELRR